MKGKTIRIFLTDGTSTGILTAEIMNWTGKVLVASRADLGLLGKREEAKRTGVYLLVGPDPEESGKDRLYIGEGDNVIHRLSHHARDENKDFWSKAVLIISKDSNLTKAHVRYLESRLIKTAQLAGRANLTNGTAPPQPNLPESDQADMEYFIDQIQMVLPVLGFSYLQSKPRLETVTPAAVEMDSDSEPETENQEAVHKPISPVFELRKVGVYARAREVEGEFIVLKGSTARKQGVPSWKTYRKLRDSLVSQSKIVLSESDPNFLAFVDDTAFASPSAAASVVLGRSANGRKSWKIEGTGKMYRDWYNETLQDAEGGDEEQK